MVRFCEFASLDFLAIIGRSLVFANLWQFWQVFHYGAMAISAMVQVLRLLGYGLMVLWLWLLAMVLLVQVLGYGYGAMVLLAIDASVWLWAIGYGAMG